MRSKRSKMPFHIGVGLALAVLGVATLFFMPAAVRAQDTQLACDARDNVLKQLKEEYGELPVAIGITDGSLVELLTAKDGTTWTIILTSPKGYSCLITSGEGWQPLVSPAGGRSV